MYCNRVYIRAHRRTTHNTKVLKGGTRTKVHFHVVHQAGRQVLDYKRVHVNHSGRVELHYT